MTSDTAQDRQTTPPPPETPIGAPLTLEELREHLRELYEAQREVQRERDALHAAHQSLIDERAQATKSLLRNQAIVRQFSGALPLGLLVIDERSADIVHANQQFCDLFDIPEMLGTIRRREITVDTLLTTCMAKVRDSAALVDGCRTEQPIDDRTIVDDEITFLDGRMLRRYSTQIRDEKDRYVARFYLFEDITARRRAEEDRVRLESQLHQAMKMQSVGRLAGGVAHDFNNMLGVIIGHVEIAMRATAATNPVREDLTAILQAAERSAALTRQLLAFARQQPVTPQQLDLNATIAGSLRMLERLISEDIRLDWQPAPTLWPLRIDPSQVDQILTNLCVNARDAIADVGTITIATANCTLTDEDCRTIPEATPGEYVRLTVRDDGCGMEPAVLQQIFEPFYTTKRIGMGTGLGLASVYGTVKQNGGVIAVSSAPDRGTTFDIFLPRPEACEQAVCPEPAPVTRSTGGETVLVVEDERAILVLVSHILSGRGYRVLSANSPRDAMEMAATHDGPIHLLLTDVIMPDMNGRDLAKAITAAHPGCRALFMSGYTADVIARHGVLADDVTFVQKPFTIDALATCVRQTLDRTT